MVIRLCSKCRREPGIYEVRRKAYMGFWGTDCLFALPGLYRDKQGRWKRKGWHIRRLGAPATPKEMIQSSIATQMEKAKQRAKSHASFWRRVALECASRTSGVAALGYFKESWHVRALSKVLCKFGYKAVDHDLLVNEAIARRFPGVEIRSEVTQSES